MTVGQHPAIGPGKEEIQRLPACVWPVWHVASFSDGLQPSRVHDLSQAKQGVVDLSAVKLSG